MPTLTGTETSLSSAVFIISCLFVNKCLFFIVRGWILSEQTSFIYAFMILVLDHGVDNLLFFLQCIISEPSLNTATQ